MSSRPGAFEEGHPFVFVYSTVTNSYPLSSNSAIRWSRSFSELVSMLT